MSMAGWFEAPGQLHVLIPRYRLRLMALISQSEILVWKWHAETCQAARNAVSGMQLNAICWCTTITTEEAYTPSCYYVAYVYDVFIHQS